ncbi:MAG: SLC13 family permease [Peptococcales bacterium]
MTKKQDILFYVHCFIGFFFMFIFPVLPPFGYITPVGMKIVGAFLGAIYLWSTVNTIWPSILGMIMIGFSGLMDVKSSLALGFGDNMTLTVLFAMILFGAIEEAGIPKYIARWFLTLKIINGRPVVMSFILLYAAYVLSALIGPLASILFFWPILYGILDDTGYKIEDAYSKIMVVGIAWGAILGHPALPIKGGHMVIMGAFQKLMGDISLPFASYTILNIIMSTLIIFVFALNLKFLFRPDMSRIVAIDVEYFKKNKLPPMDVSQKVHAVTLLLYIIFALAPSMLPKTWAITVFFNKLTIAGITMIFLVVLSLIRVNSKPILKFQQVAAKYLSWSVFALVAACTAFAATLTAEGTGISETLVLLLNPILGGQSEFSFAVIIIVLACIGTQFLNNAVYGTVLMPIIVAFSEIGGFNPVPIAMMVTLGCFTAVMTPAASPYAAVLHANKERVNSKDILKYAGPNCAIAIILYGILAYPLGILLF